MITLLATNPHSKKLPDITFGMFVHLRSADGTFSLKCRVVAVEAANIHARIEVAYDHTNGLVKRNRSSPYLRQVVIVQREHVHHAHQAPTARERIEPYIYMFGLIALFCLALRFCSGPQGVNCISTRGGEICEDWVY